MEDRRVNLEKLSISGDITIKKFLNHKINSAFDPIKP
jgi:hypothetical protein